jgi:hypothetical protein
VKLKTREIKEYRETQLQHQDQKCALCGEDIELDAVLDHDHKTGLIRQVLHRGCNSLLGKIENSMPRSRVDIRRLEGIAHNLVPYLTTQHTDIRHPTHLTIEERKMKKAKQTAMGRGRGRGKKPPKR